MGRCELASGFRSLRIARADPPVLSRRDGGSRHSAHSRRLCRSGAPRPRRGSRWRGDIHPGGDAHRAVLVSGHEPQKRRLWRAARQSHALRARNPGGLSARGGRRVPDRHPHAGRRDADGRTNTGRLYRDRAGPRILRPHRLHQRGRRECHRLQGLGKAVADDVGSFGALPEARPRNKVGSRHPDPACNPNNGRGDRGSRGQGRFRRHGRHDPGVHCRPAPCQQAEGWPAGGDPPMRRRRLLRRQGAPRQGRPVHPECRGRARADPAARYRTNDGTVEARRSGRRRTGRAGSGAGRCVARALGRPVRGGSRTRRPDCSRRQGYLAAGHDRHRALAGRRNGSARLSM